MLTRIEQILLGDTWAMQEMTSKDRLRFYRDTGIWPGYNRKELTSLIMQNDIDAERRDGKKYCADQKLARAREAGLDVK
jgi:hypothetical protein